MRTCKVNWRRCLRAASVAGCLSLTLSCGLKNSSPSSYSSTSRQEAFDLSTVQNTETRLLMGTRWTAAAALEDIFGAETVVAGSTRVKNITKTFITDEPVSWGGPCDRYSESHPMQVMGNQGYITFVTEVPHVKGCTEPSITQASLLPEGSTSRFAWTIRTCDLILSADAAVRVAATQSGLPGSSSLNSIPTSAQVRAAYDLFHPGQEAAVETYNQLKSVSDEASTLYPNSPEGWRFLLLTLCMSPSAQML